MLRPHAKRGYSGQMLKILVRTQHQEVMPDTELREESVDRSDLKAASAALIAKIGSGSMVFTSGHDQRQGSEPVENLRPRFRAAESLKKFLKNQPGRIDRSFLLKGSARKSALGLASCRSRRRASDPTLVSTRTFNSATVPPCSHTPRPTPVSRKAPRSCLVRAVR